MSHISDRKRLLLDEFEARTDDWLFSAFEQAFKEKTSQNFHDAKDLIADADADGHWPKTVKRYILTNYAALGNCSIPLDEICSRLLESMTIQERAHFGIIDKK